MAEDEKTTGGDTPPEGGEQAAGTPPEAKPAAAGPVEPTPLSPPAEGEAPAAPAAKPVAAKPPARPAAGAAGEAKPKPPAKKVSDVMETSPWEGPLVDRLKEKFGAQITSFATFQGQSFLVAQLPAAYPILEYLKTAEGFDYLVDVTAVHYPKREKPFDVVWILYSFAENVRIRVKAEAAEGDQPRSAESLYKAADWLEREVFDMFGIAFQGHPNMTRILMPEEWQGYPLRKDYSIIQQDEQWVRENLKIESGQ